MASHGEFPDFRNQAASGIPHPLQSPDQFFPPEFFIRGKREEFLRMDRARGNSLENGPQRGHHHKPGGIGKETGPDLPPLAHGFGLGRDSLERFHFPARIEEHFLVRVEKEPELPLETVRFFFIGREDHQRTPGPAKDEGKKVGRGGAFQAVNSE